jgi:S-adenosylmethionine:tRNA ribosyltransferase-isomerase
MRAVRASDFDFDLPADLIAQFPLPDRTASRLLVVDGQTAIWRDAQFRELGQWLRPGDLLVFNDTRVIPARLHGRKPTGGSVEMLLERALEGREALLHMRASKPLRDGSIVETSGGSVRVLGRQDDLFRVELPEPALACNVRR